MTLTFKHFDTRLNQWLHTDGDTNNSESILTEELNNTLLESFFPDKSFSFGQMDQYSKPEDLKNHPESSILLFSSKSRLLYGSPEALELVEKLCPDRKDRGAYGSIFLGACKNAIHENLNILVVDDANGDNGGILTNELAYSFVGDCYGQVSTDIYEKLTKREPSSQEPYHVIQHRFGWQSQDGDDDQYRFGKGTLRPYGLNKLKYADPNHTPKIDLILPISSFKGTDKDNPAGASKPQIKPGLYNQKIWLGEKSLSQQGKTAISQLIASFPQGTKDFVERLENQAQELAKIQNDPRKVAQLYCETYEKQKAIANGRNNTTSTSTNTSEKQSSVNATATDINLETDEDLDEDSDQSDQDDLFMYKLIKADLEGHCQLLETEKVKQELSRFVQNQWRDIAIGRTLSFDRGMIIPSKELKNGEICVPWFDEGEKVLNFRSPFLNSNGLCVSVNKLVEDCVGPDGQVLKGIIVVNDEDHKRIQARIESLKAQGIETNEVDPAETESERQGRDFDGDCIGVELAHKYPTLTAEAERRNLPENAYAPTVKLKKQSFYEEDGTQPQFENIAIFMSDGISVGVINNQVTALEALESEIEILQSYGSFSQQLEYLDSVSSHYQNLFAQESSDHNPKPIEPDYVQRMKEIVSLASAKDKTPEVVEQALSINRSIYRSMIEQACFQNQIAVDMFKSSRAPDMNLIKENKRYLHRDVNYIKDKKLPSAYLNTGITPKGYSPVELLINQTNQYFQQAQLESRPIVQFQDLFKEVEFTPQQKFAAIRVKQEFDQKFNEATRLDKRRHTEQGPYTIVQTSNGTQLEITNLTRYDHPGIWNAKTLNLRLKAIPQHQLRLDRPHKLLAEAQIDGETENGQAKYRPLGTISQQAAIDYKLKPGMATNGVTVVAIKPELKESQVKLLFEQALAVATNFYSSIPESQRLSAAAAAWSISASRQDEVEKTDSQVGSEHQSKEPHKKLSNFVFAAFPDEIISRLDKLQFNNLKITGISQENIDIPFQAAADNIQNKYDIEIRSNESEAQEQPGTRAVFIKDDTGEYKKYGILEQRAGQLPIGTKAQVSIVPGGSFTAKVTLAEVGKPAVEFTIREISKFSYSGQVFNNHQVTLGITNTSVPSDTVKIKLDGKVVGELDPDSINELKKANCLENNKALSLKLSSVGLATDSGAFLIGESSKGNLLRINKVNFHDFKGQKFNDVSYRNVTLDIPLSKTKTAVLLENKLLGVLHFNKDKEALKQLGVLRPGATGYIKCDLQSNFSHSYLQVDSTTVQYPQAWVKENVAAKEATPLARTAQDAIVERSVAFLQKLKERPTVLFSSQEDKTLGLIGLAVDNNKLPVVQKWLKSKDIAFDVVPKEETPVEAGKGIAVIYLSTSTISPQDLESLQTKFGKILDASGTDSPYHQYLKSLPYRPQAVEKSSDQTINPSSSQQVATKEVALAGHDATSLGNNVAIATDTSVQASSVQPEAIDDSRYSVKAEQVSSTALDALREWYVAAKELNKPQPYLDRITEVANDVKQGMALPDKAVNAMQADFNAYNQQKATAQQLNQLSDKEFLQLNHSVAEYLQDAPTPPPQVEQQLVQEKINLASTQIKSLWEKQATQVEQVGSLQAKPLAILSDRYNSAMAQLRQTQGLINNLTASKDQNVLQLQQWARQGEVYQAWQSNPMTVEIRHLAQVLKLPKQQERIASIKEQQQQSQSIKQPQKRSHEFSL